MREGKNREVRNVLHHLGLQVNRLIRVSFGPFELGDLAGGADVEQHPRPRPGILARRLVGVRRVRVRFEIERQGRVESGATLRR